MPILLVIIVLLILAGVVYMVRSPAPAPAAPPWKDEDAALLRTSVANALSERLVGWTFDAPADKPFDIVATEGGTERRISMNLKELLENWYPLHSQGKAAEAQELVQSFATGATRQDEGSDEDEVDSGELRDLLALRLLKPERVPPAGLSRPAGELRAVLVRRDQGGADLMTEDDLTKLGLSQQDAFRCAFENLQRDVEEGIEVESLDEEDPPGAVSIAPHDRLAASYALVPGLAAKIGKLVGKKNARLFIDENSLTIVVEGVEIDREKPLLADSIALDGLAWKSVPA